MKWFRVIALLLVLALGAALVPAALAQETFGLSDDDFALWTAANENSAAFDTISYAYTTDMTIAGLDPSGDFVMTVAGAGQIGTVDGVPLFSMTAVGTLGLGEDSQPFDMEVRMVGDMIFTTFNDENGWMGGSISEIFGQLGAFTGGALPIDPEALASGDLSGMEDMAAMPGMMEAMMGLSSLDPAEFIAISRPENMDGQAHFVIDIGVGELLTSDAFAPLLAMGAGQALGTGTGEMTEEEMEGMAMMVGMLFTDLELTYEQFISTETTLVQRGVLTLDFPLPSMITGGAEATINLVLGVDLSGYNEPISVEAPAEFSPMM